MKNKLCPTLFILGVLFILTSDIFFMNHLRGARIVYWMGFVCAFLGGIWSVLQWIKNKEG